MIASMSENGTRRSVFVYDPLSFGQEIAEYDGNSDLSAANVQRIYLRLPGSVDQPFLMIDYAGAGCSSSGCEHWAYADRRGSIIATTDENGDVRNQYAYSSYGVTDDEGGIPFKFTGQKYDNQSGLYYYKARWYDPETGKFLQPDPIGYGDGMNMYAYVSGDPVNLTDPSGLSSDSDCVTPDTDICVSSTPPDDEPTNLAAFGFGEGGDNSVGGSSGGSGSSSGIEQQICAATTGSRLRKCVTVTTPTALSSRDRRRLGNDFRSFILSTNGNPNISDEGITISDPNGVLADREFSLLTAVTQFVGAANLLGDLSVIIIERGDRRGLSSPLDSTCQSAPACNRVPGDGTISLFPATFRLGAFSGTPTSVARTIAHEQHHDLFGLTRLNDHRLLDRNAVLAIEFAGLADGRCSRITGFAGC